MNRKRALALLSLLATGTALAQNGEEPPGEQAPATTEAGRQEPDVAADAPRESETSPETNAPSDGQRILSTRMDELEEQAARTSVARQTLGHARRALERSEQDRRRGDRRAAERARLIAEAAVLLAERQIALEEEQRAMREAHRRATLAMTRAREARRALEHARAERERARQRLATDPRAREVDDAQEDE